MSSPVSVPPQSALVSRYSRQMLVPGLNGMAGQRAISGGSVLVVGAGGIGCTAILYLAGAGVGRMGIVDFDTVDLSNLHRQIIYRADEVGQLKSECAQRRAAALNPNIEVVTHTVRLTRENALDVLRPYDVVVDATDNFAVRYVLNDACVLLERPLVSGAAVGMEGQVTVFLPGRGCLRCVHPRPSAAEAGRSCAEVGVLGPVPGLVGCMEAIEAIKVLVLSSVAAEQCSTRGLQVLQGRQLYMDSASASCYDFELPGRNSDCAACGDRPTITSMSSIDDAAMSRSCGSRPRTELCADNEISALGFYNNVLCQNIPHILIDVRSAVQYDMVNLSSYIESYKGCVGYFSLPLAQLLKLSTAVEVESAFRSQLPTSEIRATGTLPPVFVVCRRGIDSVSATRHILSLTSPVKNDSEAVALTVKNITGGLVSWRRDVDTTFPSY